MAPTRPTSSARKLLVYGGLALLLAIAVGLTAARLMLPFASEYRAEAERRMGDYLGQRVLISRLEARLHVLSPTLVLKDVQLLDEAGRDTIARFAEIRVGLALFHSLWARAPIMERMELVGARLTVERLKDGSFRVRGLASDPDQSDPEAMGRWLLAQHRITLRDSRVEWRDARTGRNFSFKGALLELRNSGERHRLNGRLQLPAGLGGALRVAVDLEGDPLVVGGARGEFFVAGEKMRPAGLLRLFPVAGVTPGGGELSVEAWGAWQGNRLLSLEGGVNGRDLVFFANGSSETLSQVDGRFLWQRQTAGWRLEVDDLVLARAGRVWKPSRVRVDLGGGGGADERAYTVQATHLRIEALAAIARLVPVEGSWRQQLAEWAPRGDLSELRAEFGPGGRLRAGAAFTDLGVRSAPERPGFSGMDGYAYYGGQGDVAIRFHTRDAQLDLHTLFRAPLLLKRAVGEVRVRRAAEAWEVRSDGLAVANNDINARAGFLLRVPDRGAPFLDLIGDFRDGNAVTVPRYIPAHIMPTAAVTWLDRAFKAGRVVRGGVLVHGRLDQFPFDRREGRFEVRFDAQHVALDYMPEWPLLTGIGGEVVFDGRGMRVDARQAVLSGSQLADTRVEIPDLVNAELFVRGRATGSLNHLFDYLRTTGLAGHFSTALARFTAGGPYTLDLAFNQPLSDDRAGRARGTVTFDGSRLAVARGVEFTEVRGRVRFEGERYVSKGITARLLGAPARIRVDAAETGAATRLSLQGAVDASSLQRALDLPLLRRVQGRTPVDAQLLLSHQEGGESLLHLHSPLTGLGVELPEPLGKRAQERLELNSRFWFTGPRSEQLELTLGERFSTTLLVPSDPSPSRAAIHFGAVPPALPANPGYVITGRLPTFAPAPWAELLALAGGGSQGAAVEGAAGPPPVRIDLEELGIVAPSGEDETPDAGGGAPRVGPLPLLDVRIGELRYGDARLGAAAFHTENQGSTVLLQDLKLAGPHFVLTGKAQWQRGRRPRTEAELRVTGKDLGAVTKELGVASVINKGAFEFQSQIAWEGEPQDFALERLEGSLKVKLKDGTMAEVKPGAGRLIGLLSVHALPQRLTLDFRDMFDKGMRFRSVEGRFEFRDGDAFTDNLYMNALPAAVFVSGRTGLARRDLDQTVTVVPDVSGTLPVAGGLMLGPQVGAALLLVQQLFHKKIDDSAKFKYTVTGSWESPVVKRVSKKR